MRTLFSILSFLLLLFLKVDAKAQGDVVVHTPPGLEKLLHKKHNGVNPIAKETIHLSSNDKLLADAGLGMPAGNKHIGENTAVRPARMEENSMHPAFRRPDRVIYSGKGFRVQIYYGPDRSKAVKIKKEFMRYHPEVRTYLSYYPPYFRVKVGDYRYRANAIGMLKEANSMYSPSMIVPDKVTISAF